MLCRYVLCLNDILYFLYIFAQRQFALLTCLFTVWFLTILCTFRVSRTLIRFRNKFRYASSVRVSMNLLFIMHYFRYGKFPLFFFREKNFRNTPKFMVRRCDVWIYRCVFRSPFWAPLVTFLAPPLTSIYSWLSSPASCSLFYYSILTLLRLWYFLSLTLTVKLI